MLPDEHYRGREQTYLKHFVLEHYLTSLAYHIGFGWNGKPLLYVDCFSGPWKSSDESFKDTSFQLAIEALRKVKDDLKVRGLAFDPRCIFVEKDQPAYQELKDAVAGVSDIQIELLHGEFESKVPEILARVGSDFTFTFVDPTGWTGFALSRIGTLLRHRPGEVLINFMFPFINRFLSKSDPGYPETFDALFGGGGWGHLLEKSERQEQKILDFYCERLSSNGGFERVTHTRILNPLKNTTHFHLVYGTRHCAGLEVFRRVEKSLVVEQDKVRTRAKQKHRIERSNELELFDDVEVGLVDMASAPEREIRIREAGDRLNSILKPGHPVGYQEIKCQLLQSPFVWESDVNSMLNDLRKRNLIQIPEMKPRERVPKKGYTIIPQKM